MAGVAQGDAGLALVERLVAVTPWPFCVAGIALGGMDAHFARQVWHFVTVTRTLCGTW